MTKPYPKTASGFLRVVEQKAISGIPQLIAMQEDSAEDDGTQRVRTVFVIERSEDQPLAWVEHSYGRLSVHLLEDGDHRDSAYWFDLDRLHENFPGWSWSQQISGKCWARSEHSALLDELCRLFPTSAYARSSNANTKAA